MPFIMLLRIFSFFDDKYSFNIWICNIHYKISVSIVDSVKFFFRIMTHY